MPKDPIQNFTEHVDSLISEVRESGNSSFRKVLYLVMLDGLSTYRFPDPDVGAKKRFVEFVKEFADWSDCNRVSLPHLDLLLREEEGTKYQQLQALVANRLQQWQDSQVYHLKEVDPFPQDLGDDPVVRECQHAQLLWAYRNALIHEFREPGFAFDLDHSKSSPYYLQMNFTQGPLAGSVGWELVIPSTFLENLARTSLKNLATYLHEEGLDPKSLGYRGRAWVARLRRLSKG